MVTLIAEAGFVSLATMPLLAFAAEIDSRVVVLPVGSAQPNAGVLVEIRVVLQALAVSLLCPRIEDPLICAAIVHLAICGHCRSCRYSGNDAKSLYFGQLAEEPCLKKNAVP